VRVKAEPAFKGRVRLSGIIYCLTLINKPIQLKYAVAREINLAFNVGCISTDKGEVVNLTQRQKKDCVLTPTPSPTKPHCLHPKINPIACTLK
jgi:hypothetical protein